MLFRLGSTTKMFTAAALVTLAGRGAIDLNAPVGSYVTGLNPKVGQVTGDQLLSHTSGFFDEAPMFGSHDETALDKEVRSWGDARFFTEPGKSSRIRIPATGTPGSSSSRPSKKKYADELEASIFGPLGMKSTTLRPLVAITFPLAQGHEEAPQGARVIRPAANNAASWPAGSIFSNVVDLSRFVIAFMNNGQIDGKQVLSPAVIRALSTPRAKIPGGNGSYGYGLQIAKYRGLDVVSHGGSRAGYGSSIQDGAVEEVRRHHRREPDRHRPQRDRREGDGGRPVPPAGQQLDRGVTVGRCRPACLRRNLLAGPEDH